MVKYGLLTCLGRKATLQALLGGRVRVGLGRGCGLRGVLVGVVLGGAAAGGGAEDEGGGDGDAARAAGLAVVLRDMGSCLCGVRRWYSRGRNGSWLAYEVAGAGEGWRRRRRLPCSGLTSCRPTRGASTETTSSTPVTMIWDWAETLTQAHHVLQRAEQEHPGDGAAEGALAAVEVDAAEQHGGDDGQFEAGRVVVAGAGVVQGPEDAGERGEQRRSRRTCSSLSRLTRMPGEARGLLAGADGEQRAADRRWRAARPRRSASSTTNGQGGYGRKVSPIRPAPKSRYCVREVGDRVGAEHDLGHAPVGGQGADGDGQRRQPEPGDQQAVEQAADDAEQQTHRDDRLDGHARVPQRAHHGAGQARPWRRRTDRPRRRRPASSSAARSARSAACCRSGTTG